MKMRVLGFSWVEEFLPRSVSAASVFERIEVVSGETFKKHVGAATKVGEWWSGVLLKIRDAKSFTKKREENGVIVVVSTEPLAEGEELRKR